MGCKTVNMSNQFKARLRAQIRATIGWTLLLVSALDAGVPCALATRTEVTTARVSTRVTDGRRAIGSMNSAARAESLRILLFAATPARLPAAGAALNLHAVVTGAKTCRFTSAKAHLARQVPCPTGSARITVHIAANPSASSQTYRFELTAIGVRGTKRRSVSVFQAGWSAPPGATTSTTTGTSVPTTGTSAPTTGTSVPTTIPSGGSFHPVLTSQWAGYFETPGPVTTVSATWVVPSLTCPSTTTLSSTWVGVGGFSGGTLLQAGMYDNCIGGTAENGAFAEEYPGPTVSFGLFISAGDTVTATVSDDSGQWQAGVTDVTTGKGETSSAPDYTGGDSAEWMAEAYGAPGGVPMSNFGTERLSAFSVNGAPAQISESDVYEMANVTPSDPATGVYQLTHG